MVHLHNGILLNNLKKGITKFSGKWVELENIVLSEVTQIQKNMLISGYLPKKKYRIPKIQSTELKMFNKLKVSSKYTLVPLGREKKAITSGEGGRDLRGEVEVVEGEKGNLI